MSRRAAVIEEEFDDDTDLPLPSHPLPNSNPRGPLLEEIGDFNDVPSLRPPTAGPASPSALQKQFGPNEGTHLGSSDDLTPYKTWTCIYPIYIDAKRPYGTGERRIARQKSVWWPLSKDIVDAAQRLRLGTLHEVGKAHPRDWENPGRVKVLWKKDGRFVNPLIKTKKHLLEQISLQIQQFKPDLIPKPPYTYPSASQTQRSIAVPQSQSKITASANSKGKQKAKATPTATATSKIKVSGRSLPEPPQPFPALASRVSPYSPALPTGVLIETIKAGMNATQQEGAAAGGGPGGAAGGPKGKRKVVRVRG